MSEPVVADLLAKGIEAARAGNRPLARLHFERACLSDSVDPVVWMWMAWTADSPSQAGLHLKKLQTGLYADLAAAGMQWIGALASVPPSPERPLELDSLNATLGQELPDDNPRAAAEPVYSMGCPGCRGHLHIRGKLVGPLHRCPACRAVFVAEQDANDSTRFTRRLLSSESARTNNPEISARHASGDDVKQPVILVLDNRTTRRQLMLNVLCRAGFRVLPAVSCDETLDLASQHKPQVILLDGNMPGLNGFEICKTLRTTIATKTIPILMLSNKSGFFDQVQAKLSGCTAYITKPCDSEVLLEHVRQLARTLGESISKPPRIELKNGMFGDASKVGSRQDQAATYLRNPAGIDPDPSVKFEVNNSSSSSQASHSEDQGVEDLRESIFG